MEPLAALGVAAAVAQFVQFAGSLISTTNEIFHSANGVSADNLKAEEVYAKLFDFSKRLEVQGIGPKFHQKDESAGKRSHHTGKALQPSREQVLVLMQLSSDCRADCGELLELLQKLKAPGDRNRFWMSIRASLRTVWDAKKIEALEKRLERSQRAITVHIGSFLSDQVSALDVRLSSLKSENERLHFDQSSKLDKISQGMRELRLELERVAVASQNPDAARPQDHLVVEKMTSLLTTLTSTAAELSTEQAILNSLKFRQMPVRHGNIAEAHATTFRWIFHSSFSEWLRSDKGIFCVSGKAGSGKSTLMKFITSNANTSKLLANWAPDGVAIVAHYFWTAGTEMQKSQKGLLQTLLYEIFKNSPQIIAEACPKRWLAGKTSIHRKKSEAWSVSELSAALTYVATAKNISSKFCCFIDGLDEYNGDHLDLCELMKSLSTSANIKLCISSRPWTVFEDAFGHGQKLYMQDLTKEDIFNYTKARLESHPRWTACSIAETARQAFIEEIRVRAEGVFLWVFLVTKSLKDGLTNDDTIDDLKRRLDSLPTDLEHLFKHMLGNVDPIYHDKMARTMLVALAADEPLTLVIYGNHDEEYQDKDYAVRRRVWAMTPAEVTSLCDTTRRRIDARSRGLLEARGKTVEFLHRTVRDFLFTKEMSDFLTAKVKGRFDASFSITKAYVALIKSLRFLSEYDTPVTRGLNGNSGTLIQLIRTTLDYASRAEPCHMKQIANLLNNLESSIEKMFKDGQADFSSKRRCDPKLLLHEEILKSELVWYVAKRLEKSDFLSNFEIPPLYVICGRSGRLQIRRNFEVLQMLLEHGENPNKPYGRLLESTPWLAVAWRTSLFGPGGYKDTRLFQDSIDNGLLSKFLASGADPNAKRPDSGLTVFALYLFSAFSRHVKTSLTNAYLRTLDVFLETGADLNAEITNPGFSQRVKNVLVCDSIDWWSDIESTDGPVSTVCTIFCSALKKFALSQDANSKRLVFLASVAKRLIILGRHDTETTMQFIFAIRESFPPDLSGDLREELQRRIPATDNSDNGITAAGWDEAGSREESPCLGRSNAHTLAKNVGTCASEQLETEVSRVASSLGALALRS